MEPRKAWESTELFWALTTRLAAASAPGCRAQRRGLVPKSRVGEREPHESLLGIRPDTGDPLESLDRLLRALDPQVEVAEVERGGKIRGLRRGRLQIGLGLLGPTLGGIRLDQELTG